MDRHRIEVVQLLPAATERDHQRRLLQKHEMLGHGLATHVEMLAELAERLPVVRVQLVEQEPSAGVGESLEHLVHVGVHDVIMQPFGCMSREPGCSFQTGK